MMKPALHPLEAARQETINALDLGTSGSEPTYDAIVSLLADAIDVPICLLSIVDGGRQYFKSNIGLRVDEIPRDISFCGHAILRSDELMVVEDTALDERFSDNPLVLGYPNIRFYAGAVINAPNNLPVGTVCVIDRNPRTLSDQERRHLLCAKHLMESAISLRAQSLHDHLTGLYNRRYFDDCLAKEWRRAYRHTVPLTILMLDVDFFKDFNDRFGHPAGDECLRRIAEAVCGVLNRAGDLVARYGGEEFVAVLPATPPEGAQQLGDRIREAIKALAIASPRVPGGSVTVSVGGGIALNKEQFARGPEALLAVADEALFAAKAAGRDCCIVRELPPMTLENGVPAGGGLEHLQRRLPRERKQHQRRDEEDPEPRRDVVEVWSEPGCAPRAARRRSTPRGCYSTGRTGSSSAAQRR